jgi:hypothetical protein
MPAIADGPAGRAASVAGSVATGSQRSGRPAPAGRGRRRRCGGRRGPSTSNQASASCGGPSNARCPPCASSTTRSHARTSAGAWVVTITVVPWDATARSTRMTSAAVAGSSPEVGSSSSRTCGDVSSSTAMLARLRCPPDSSGHGRRRGRRGRVRRGRGRPPRRWRLGSSSVAAGGGRRRHGSPQRKIEVDDVVLRDAADPLTRRSVGDVRCRRAHAAAVRRADPGEGLQQRGLAGAAAADDRDQLAAPNVSEMSASRVRSATCWDRFDARSPGRARGRSRSP